jgi:predicted small metal-binding protein
LLKKVAEHAADAHGVKEVSPELLATVRSAIKSE